MHTYIQEYVHTYRHARTHTNIPSFSLRVERATQDSQSLRGALWPTPSSTAARTNPAPGSGPRGRTPSGGKRSSA
eukprot:9134990-Pyramimonas_sp.AAC.1